MVRKPNIHSFHNLFMGCTTSPMRQLMRFPQDAQKEHPREGPLAQRARFVVSRLLREYPDADCALKHRSAFELLVATILSAQCTDERVNKVTPAVFRTYGTPEQMAAAPLGRLQRLIWPTGFYRNKARALKGAARAIVERFGGQVPRRMEDLLILPGVARKTANVVLGTWYGIASGITVDTHVFRLAHRLGLSCQRDPKKVERDLMALVPQRHWIHFGHAMIWHGRGVCRARRPECERCVLAARCPSAETVGSKQKQVARKT